MKNALTLTAMLTLSSFFGISQIEAITENGDVVLLFNDGTWKSAEELSVEKEVYVMPTPEFSGNTKEGSESVSHKISIISSSSNDITDDEKWFRENDLSLPTYDVPNSFRGVKGNVPDKTPLSYQGEMLIRAMHSVQYNFFVYGRNFSEGRYLIITDKKMEQVLHVLDFQSYMLSPDYVEEDRMFIDQSIWWVEVEGDILYVSHGHHTYAESSKGMNAYITAIDLNSYAVLWRTKPLVCNTNNFLVFDDMIVCGYGFTAEKDYMYVLNKSNGKIAQKLLVKTGPEWIIKKEDQLFVRTYNMDYVFKVN